ncbi:MAG: CRISPR-associated protein Csx3, partial [Desulfatiglandales bacterium]
MKRHLLFFLAFTFLFVSLGVSKSNSQDIGAFIYEHFTKKEQIKALPKQITMEEAIGVQKAFVSLLGKDHGRQIGYKAGLTNPKAQEAFGVKEPVLGILFEKMLLKSGATVNVAFGARPVTEGDLIIRVGDEKINDAKTPEEALSYLDQVIPFIELPDLMFAPDTKLDGPSIVAITGRGPIWLYSVLTHVLHIAVALYVFDPRLGYVCV